MVVQKFPDKMERPRVIAGRGHGRKPDLPVDPGMIRRDESRNPVRISRLSHELVLFPFGLAGNDRIFASFKDNSVTLTTDRSERAVGVNQIEWVERIVHELASADKVQHWRDAQPGNEDR